MVKEHHTITIPHFFKELATRIALSINTKGNAHLASTIKRGDQVAQDDRIYSADGHTGPCPYPINFLNLSFSSVCSSVRSTFFVSLE